LVLVKKIFLLGYVIPIARILKNKKQFITLAVLDTRVLD
jgi:hypothetical protein